MSLRDSATDLAPDLVRLRRALHRDPEVGLDLPRTQEKVLAALDGLSLEVTTGSALTSVAAVLRGGRPGPVVLLRGDMDALPVTERAPVPFASRNGAMHACGHDLHTAMLVGAAHLLSARRADVAGDVVLMFQPGEEGWDGAKAMLAEGVLNAAGRRPVAAYALHVTSAAVPRGVVATRPGPMLAASGALTVTVHGEGGHGATPHRAADPIPATCEMVTALQTMVTRRFDVFDPVVVTVGVLRAGTRRNVIPETAEFEATVRTFSAGAAARIADAAVALIRQIASAHGLRADVTYEPEYPLTVNDDTETTFLSTTVREVLGEDRIERMRNPLTGSEDFSRVLGEIPGAMAMLGACAPGTDPSVTPYNHSPFAEFDDTLLADGAALYAELAMRRLTAA